MKKTFTTIFLAVIMILSCFCVHIYAQTPIGDVGVFFDANNNILQISGTIGNETNRPVTVHLSKYTDTEPVFSVKEPPIASYLFFTKNNGILSEKIRISNNLRNNKYGVHFYYNDGVSDVYSSDSFIFFNQSSSEAVETIERLNSASSENEFTAIVLNKNNALALGIDLSKINEHSSYAASLSYKLRKIQEDEKYTTITFYNTFSGCIAASIITNEHNVPEAVNSYSSSLGTSTEEYTNLSDAQKAELNSLLESADYSKKAISDIYNEKLQISSLKISQNRDDFKNELLNNRNFEVSEKDTNYLKIPKTYRHLVFSDMYDEKKDYASLDDVKDSFDKNVQNIYNKYGKKDSSGSSNTSSPSKGGGASSNITSDTDILIPNPNKIPDNPVIQDKSFTDTENHWAEKSIDFLSSKGAINGFPDGSFKPDDTVTRAQFAQITRLTFELTDEGSENYSDVSEDDWYYESISILSSLKLVNGYGTYFAPDDNIKREDMAVIIYRLCSYLGIKSGSNNQGFTDSEEISDYAKDAVSALSANSIIRGDNGMFHPQRQLSRGEAATIIERVYNIYAGGDVQ